MVRLGFGRARNKLGAGRHGGGAEVGACDGVRGGVSIGMRDGVDVRAVGPTCSGCSVHNDGAEAGDEEDE